MQINKMGDYLLEQTNFDRQTNELSIKQITHWCFYDIPIV